MSDEIKERTVYMLRWADGGNGIYVGSTSQALKERLREHKKDAGNPSRLKYYGSSKLYQKMREVGVQHWEIVPLLTFACDQNTIFEFEREWIKALNANLNTFSPIDENLDRRRNKIKYRIKNKETKLYYCELCGLACKDNYDLNRHFGTLKHSYAWLNSFD